MATNVRAVMTIEINRISSLTDFKPSWMRPSACLLAHWGFYWDGKSEGVLICVHCRQTADRTVLEDNPLERHRKKNPICPMFKDNASTHPSIVPQDVLHEFYQKRRLNRPLDSTDGRQVDLPAGKDGLTAFIRVQSLLNVLKSSIERASSHGLLNSSTTLSSSVFNRLDPDFQMLCNEAMRLATFHDWPDYANAKPEALAKAGLFYTGTVDRVQCAFCQNFLRNWAESDIPMEEHRKKFPDCRFVQGTVADRESVDGVESEVSKERQTVIDSLYKGVDLRGEDIPVVYLGSNVARKAARRNAPGHPEYTDETKRMQSFINKTVPKGQNINVLANAGFFYYGPNDNTKCFYCNGGLRNWGPSDDPWVEHTRWFPQCGYLRSRRDPGYIKVIQDAFRPTLRAIEDWKKNHATKVEQSSQQLEAVATPDRESVATPERSATPTAGDTTDTTVTGPEDASKNLSKAAKKKNKKKKNKAAKRDQKNDGSAATAEEVTTATSTDRTAATGTDEETRAVFDENRTLHESKICKVCMDEDVNVVFLPCGHLACCNNCAPSMPHCPICRGLIRGTVRVFLS